MKLKLNWESALLALLIVEILLFGALNPRMLDLNMLLFSTSDFICIGIVALPLTLVIISGGIDISLGSTIGLCAIALGVMMQSGWPMASLPSRRWRQKRLRPLQMPRKDKPKVLTPVS